MVASTASFPLRACTLVKIAEWPVRLVQGLPVIDGAIDGKPVRVLIDTGATHSLLYRPAAARLGIALRPLDGAVVYGTGGESRVDVAALSEFRLGKAVRKDWSVPVAGDQASHPFDFILGEDFLENADMELDYPAGQVRLFQPRDCGNRPLAYWAPQTAVQVAIEHGLRVHLLARLNDTPLNVMLDTGASASIVSEEMARTLGLTRASPGAEDRGCGSGVGAKAMERWSVPFKSFEIGAQKIHDPTLDVGAIFRHARTATPGTRLRGHFESTPAMILGSDFLSVHRVMIARSQRKLYFTHTGGIAFPPTGKGSCARISTSALGSELKEARTRGDEVAARRTLERIEEQVGGKLADAPTFIERGRMWSEHGERDRALADFEAALAIDPGNANARWERGLLRMHAKQWDIALADMEASLAANPSGKGILFNIALIHFEKREHEAALRAIDEALRLAPDWMGALRLRGDIWARLGDDRRAIADYDRAAELGHRHVSRVRGRANFRLGRFEQAAQDFAVIPAGGTATDVAYDPLWRYFAVARAGGEGRGELAAAAAKMTGWPRQLAAFLLGERDADALLASAAEGEMRVERVCEARFAIAQRWLIARDAAKAKPWLEKAREECPVNYLEKAAAAAELARP